MGVCLILNPVATEETAESKAAERMITTQEVEAAMEGAGEMAEKEEGREDMEAETQTVVIKGAEAETTEANARKKVEVGETMELQIGK